MAENNSSAPLLPWPPAIDELPETVIDAVAAALGDTYDCLRVWSAWSYGTMGPDDFRLVAEDGERTAEIARAAIEAYVAATQAVAAQTAPAAPDANRLRAEILEHSSKASRLVRTLFNEPTGTLSDVEVGDWIQRAQQYLSLATPALPATEDSSAGDLAEVQAEPVAAGEYLPLPMQYACAGPFPVYSAYQMRAYADAHRSTAPQAQPADALDAEVLERAAEAIYEADKDSWCTYGRYQDLHKDDKARCRAMAKAAMAAAQEGGNAAKEA